MASFVSFIPFHSCTNVSNFNLWKNEIAIWMEKSFSLLFSTLNISSFSDCFSLDSIWIHYTYSVQNVNNPFKMVNFLCWKDSFLTFWSSRLSVPYFWKRMFRCGLAYTHLVYNHYTKVEKSVWLPIEMTFHIVHHQLA